MDTSAPREWIARLLLRTLTAVSVTSKNEAAAIAIYEKQKLRQGVRGGGSLEREVRGRGQRNKWSFGLAGYLRPTS
jgi:hypothetical protein